MQSFQRAALLGLVFLVSSPGAKSQTLPGMQVPFIEREVVFADGLPDEISKKAASVPLTDPWGQKGYPIEETKVYLWHTKAAFCVLFICADKEIKAEKLLRDDRTHHDDCVEVLLGPALETFSDAIVLEINARGTVADFYYRHQGWVNYSWQPDDIGIKVQQTADLAGFGLSGPGYVTQVVIPFTEISRSLALSTDGVPDKLRANFGRWDYGAAGRMFTIWSDPQLKELTPHRPERYGWLTFEKE